MYEILEKKIDFFLTRDIINATKYSPSSGSSMKKGRFPQADLILCYARFFIVSTIPGRPRVIDLLNKISLKVFLRVVLLFYNALTNFLLCDKLCQVFFWDVRDVALLQWIKSSLSLAFTL